MASIRYFLVLLAGLAACSVPQSAPTPSAVDRAAAHFVQALLQRDVEVISSLIREEGVAFPHKWPGGVDPRDIHPRDFATGLIAQGVLDGEPSCVGYTPDWGALPTSALLIIDGLAIDWTAVGFLEARPDLAGIVLTESSRDEWEITAILPVSSILQVSDIAELRSCP
ncbi:MAG: hypothetical protein WD906_08670 [Anaerolineales bacterium]